MTNATKIRRMSKAAAVMSLREARKASGLCARCGGPVEEGFVECSACRTKARDLYRRNIEKRRAAHRETIAFYKRKGICIICGQREAEPHRTRCLECTERYAESVRAYKNRPDVKERAKSYQHERKERLKAKGICVWCGKRPAEGGRVTCNRCNLKQRLYYQRTKKPKAYRECGLCVWCGAEPVDGYNLCSDCLEKARERIKKASEKRLEMIARGDLRDPVREALNGLFKGANRGKNQVPKEQRAGI